MPQASRHLPFTLHSSSGGRLFFSIILPRKVYSPTHIFEHHGRLTISGLRKTCVVAGVWPVSDASISSALLATWRFMAEESEPSSRKGRQEMQRRAERSVRPERQRDRQMPGCPLRSRFLCGSVASHRSGWHRNRFGRGACATRFCAKNTFLTPAASPAYHALDRVRGWGAARAVWMAWDLEW